MDTDKCAALLRSIDLGSLAAAAEELGYTPSGISRMVASLEKEWGFPLLIRSKSGVRPTVDCERMLLALRNLAAAARVCGEQAAAVRGLETGSIVVGSAYRQYYNVLAGVIADFIAEHPNIQVSVLHANSSTLKQMLDDRRIDLAIMSKRGDPARWTPLINDPMMAVLPRTHELAGAKSYPVGRFAQDPFVEVYPDEESDNTVALAESGIKPNTRYSAFDALAAFALVEAGLGVTITNGVYSRSADMDAVSLPLDPPYSVEIGIAAPDTQAASPALAAFEAFALPRLASAKV